MVPSQIPTLKKKSLINVNSRIHLRSSQLPLLGFTMFHCSHRIQGVMIHGYTAFLGWWFLTGTPPWAKTVDNLGADNTGITLYSTVTSNQRSCVPTPVQSNILCSSKIDLKLYPVSLPFFLSQSLLLNVYVYILRPLLFRCMIVSNNIS